MAPWIGIIALTGINWAIAANINIPPPMPSDAVSIEVKQLTTMRPIKLSQFRVSGIANKSSINEG